jgi:hypothetical protein
MLYATHSMNPLRADPSETASALAVPFADARERRGSTAWERKNGSPQEFVSNGILRGFLDVLKSDIFGIGNGHAASLQ